MKFIIEIQNELKEQMMFQSELAGKMKGNTKTRIKDLSSILNKKREPGAQLLEEIADGLNCEWKLVRKQKVIKDYIIFDKGTPAYPGVYQVLGLLDGMYDRSTTMLHSDLEYIREKLAGKGMKRISSEKYKHPLVIEVWEGEDLFPGIIV